MARTLFQHIEAIDKMFSKIPYQAYLVVAGFLILMIGAMVQQRVTYEETFPSDLNISLDDDYSDSKTFTINRTPLQELNISEDYFNATAE